MVILKNWKKSVCITTRSPVEILHAAQELQALNEVVAEVIINTKLKLNFAKLN